MMFVIALLAGFLPPTIIGWALLRILEGQFPVLTTIERWICGAALGVTTTMVMVFSVHAWTGVELHWWSILAIECIPAITLTFLALRMKGSSPARTPTIRPPLWIRITLGILLLIAALKIAAAIFITMTTPAFYSDTFSNWNYRAKVFADMHAIPLALPPDTKPSPLSSYPPTVPLLKANLALLNGGWNEGLANLPHEVWFLLTGAVLWFLLRRRTSAAWAIFGTVTYWSLPLAFMHGVNAYADVFLSLHYLCLVHFLLIALTADSDDRALAAVRLSILPIALLPFTKNEGFALYLPVTLLLLVGAGFLLRKNGMLTINRLKVPALWLVGLLGAVLLSWIGYKTRFGLTFGNAKALSDLGIGWQPMVVSSIFFNTFVEGNWLLLFPFLIALVLKNIRAIGRSSTFLFLLAAVLLPYTIQLLLFLFTSLSSEAIMQTGYARGIIQIVPVIVALTTLLLQKTVHDHRQLPNL